MKPNLNDEIRIVELVKSESLPRLEDQYSIAAYYDLSIIHESKGWRTELSLKPLDNPSLRNYTGRFFEEHIEEPRVFTAVLGEKQVGWIELGYDKWNNRMRVWEFLVKKEFRGKGIGAMLMTWAKKVAKERGARMLVLETQSNNDSAIAFYLRQGFELIGFDAAAYSNSDIEKKEVRLEFGLKL